jgi:hypothetical protein
VADAGANLELIQLSAMIGTGLPVVVAVFKQDRFSRRTNTIVAVTVAVATAFVVTAARHELGALNVFASFTAIYTTAVAFHHGLWKPSGIAPDVRRRTSRRNSSGRAAAARTGPARPTNQIRPSAVRRAPEWVSTNERVDRARC